jgi:hypothetical protein
LRRQATGNALAGVVQVINPQSLFASFPSTQKDGGGFLPRDIFLDTCRINAYYKRIRVRELGFFSFSGKVLSTKITTISIPRI